MRVAVAQMTASIHLGTSPEGPEGFRPWALQAKEAGCHLVLFPLLPVTLSDDGAFFGAVAALARETGLMLGFAAETSGPTGTARGGYLFGTDGRLLGRQAQTQVLPEERVGGIVPGTTLEPISLPPPAPAGLKAGFLVGSDAWYPEVARILTLKGAALLLAPVAMRAPYSPWRQVAAIWQQVQQNQVFGLEACLVGSGTAHSYAGRSAIFAPCEMTPGETGILAQIGVDPKAIDPGQWADGLSAAGSAEPGLVVADLDFDALQRTVDGYSLWEQQNLDFYRSFFPGVYGKTPAGSRETGDGGETP